MEKIVVTKKFSVPVVREYSYTSKVEDLGVKECEFKLVIHASGKTGGLICDYGDAGYQDMGLWFDDNKNLTDYDGAFCLPDQGIEMLREAGFVVSEEFEN
jgi:hypothetical protein